MSDDRDAARSAASSLRWRGLLWAAILLSLVGVVLIAVFGLENPAIALLALLATLAGIYVISQRGLGNSAESYLRSRAETRLEHGSVSAGDVVPTREFRGGARLGHEWNATWPFAQLAIEPSKLTLRIVGIDPVVVERPCVKSVSIHKGLTYSGIKIEHRRGTGFFIFWSHPLSEVIDALHEAGYP